MGAYKYYSRVMDVIQVFQFVIFLFFIYSFSLFVGLFSMLRICLVRRLTMMLGATVPVHDAERQTCYSKDMPRF